MDEDMEDLNIGLEHITLKIIDYGTVEMKRTISYFKNPNNLSVWKDNDINRKW